MDWHPNRDAVEFFARSILPHIRAKYPQVKFIVAGRNPPPQFVAQFSSDPGIEFTGTVADMRPYLANATVVVVPLRIGGGTRIKILEACAAGKPVVSTTIGAEGLDVVPGREILVADAPTDFANLVVRLLDDPLQSEVLAKGARAKIVDRYSSSALNKALETVISRIR
jgi:glycosyltransferase involved in cell wall biosynthesis